MVEATKLILKSRRVDSAHFNALGIILDLTVKRGMLFCLTTALHHLDIRYIVKSYSKVKFSFAKLDKRWDKGKLPLLLFIVRFPEIPLCCRDIR